MGRALWIIGSFLAGVIALVIVLVLLVMARTMRTCWKYGDISNLGMKLAQIRAFFPMVEAHFKSKGKTARIWDGVANVAYDNSPEPHQLGLQNLAQICAQIDQKEWPETIAKHFDALERSQDEQKKLLANIENYDAIKSHLAVRLMPKMGVPLETLVWREDLQGVITNLVFDLPGSIRTVHIDEEKRWPVGLTELFDVALENTKQLTKPEVSEPELGDGMKLIGVTGADNYVTSHVLLLHEHPEWLGPHGALVAIPHRHALLIFPIRDKSVVDAVPKLAFIARGMEQEGPGSVTPNIYLYRDGKFMHIPVELAKHQANVMPPDEFVQMLNAITAEPEAPPAA